jgi:hypothetical protein
MARGKIRYTLAHKHRIVQQAYSISSNIKRTARDFNVQPSQIRAWKKALASVDDSKMGRFVNRKVGSQAQLPDVYVHLTQFFDQMRSLDRPVSISMLCREAKR